jgi:serpin B
LDDRQQQAKSSGGAASMAGVDAGERVNGSAGATALGAATAELPDGVTRTPIERVPAAALSGAVRANNEFGTALFGALRTESAGKNFLTSPISASLALGMTYAGAREQTRAELARALRIDPQTGDSFFEGQNALSQMLGQRGIEAYAVAQSAFRGSAPPPDAQDYSLEIVNSLWGQGSYPWEAPFLKTLAANYGAGLFKREFTTEAQSTRLEINRWVSTHTSEKIQDLLPASAVTAETRLVLVNALHLKLPWDKEFTKSATAVAPFTRSDHKQVSVPFMHRQAKLAYRDDGSAQIVGLPLSTRRLWVIIALPHPGVPLAEYERTLRADSPALQVPSKEALVTLALPKVTFTSPTFSLSDALRRLGMAQAFDPKHAHFEGMSKTPPGEVPLYIGDVVQKTMIAMQENGIEAAAATAVVMMAGTAYMPHKEPTPIPMIVNRPYLVSLVDQPTGAVLMLGHIEEPKE